MTRALLIVLDSVGVGGAPDAAAYDDAGADTLGHVARACAAGAADRAGLRQGPLAVPNLVALGLGAAAREATGEVPPGLEAAPQRGLFGCAVETSRGKDTPSGHWELAGVPVTWDWGYFPKTVPALPESLTEALIAEAGLPGILGNRHDSGTAVLDDLGEEHLRTGKPILYTSVDSVLQIAAHEERFGLERLYALCAIARRLCDPLRIGRVIARPFLGAAAGDFRRTGNRKDYSVLPPSPTVLDRLTRQARAIVTVGKIGDIFAHSGTGREVKPHGNDAVLDATIDAMRTLPNGGLVFSNLVDFDSEYGHRRDVAGYAAALEAFDRRVPEIEAVLKPGDLAIITADHGNDPTWKGTDHTREKVPVLAFGPGLPTGPIGTRSTFADVGASVLSHLGIDPAEAGTSFLPR